MATPRCQTVEDLQENLDFVSEILAFYAAAPDSYRDPCQKKPQHLICYGSDGCDDYSLYDDPPLYIPPVGDFIDRNGFIHHMAEVDVSRLGTPAPFFVQHYDGSSEDFFRPGILSQELSSREPFEKAFSCPEPSGKKLFEKISSDQEHNDKEPHGQGDTSRAPSEELFSEIERSVELSSGDEFFDAEPFHTSSQIFSSNSKDLFTVDLQERPHSR
jgi:hypothetical protein